MRHHHASPELGPFAAFTDPWLAIGEDGRIVAVNQGMAGLLGMDPHDLVGIDAGDAFPEANRSPFADAARRAGETGLAQAVTAAYAPLGADLHCRFFPHAAGVLVTVADVSRVEAAQRSLTRLAELHERVCTVATAVAAGRPTCEVFDLLVRETVALAGAQFGNVARFDETGHASILGASHALPADSALRARSGALLHVGAEIPVTSGSACERVRDSGRTVAVISYDSSRWSGLFRRLGYRAAVFVPIEVGGRTWGMTTLGFVDPQPGIGELAPELERFARLAAMAVAGTEAQAALAARAVTDPLTGLHNSAAFHARLSAEVERSRRSSQNRFCLAVLDVDDFKAINDTFGHAAGDRALRAVGRELSSMCRAGDVAGRVGGDEFALVLSGIDRYEALAVLERVRRRVAEGLPAEDGLELRISAGICEWEPGRDEDEVFRLADDALYWAKSNGRDAAWIHDPEVVPHFDPAARREAQHRGQALSALRALARAIDAKDPATRAHSERVACTAEAIARRLGWSETRAAALHEAGLVHDVGKIGVPDAILLKAGRLEPDEYEQVKRHAALGADIVEGVLSPEQVSWIRAHHERPDGTGYPDGLAGERIPDGAAILAAADAWDAMTAARLYSSPIPPAEALAQCRRLAGRQFRADVLDALAAVVGGEPQVGLPTPLALPRSTVPA